MDILRTAWLPTDIGVVTPTDALKRASALAWNRGDWEIATICLLHAMVQTAVVLEPQRCPNRRAWESLRRTPPEDLELWFDWAMGDHLWECPTAQGLVPIGRLMPESPGDNAIKKCSDIAHWQQDVRTELTLPEATIALISDNLWGTRIGTGFYQGARGEQSLTTLVEPAAREASIWERVWLNVLPADEWKKHNDNGNKTPFSFPWQQPIPPLPMTPDNTHSAGILWQMPRRWRLVQDDDGLVRQAHRENKGRDYEGWEKLHPLTPYFVKTDGTWTAAKVSVHTGFRNWAAIALHNRKKTRPATVVSAYVQMAWQDEPLRLRCCGWALADAGAAGGWVDHVVPFYPKGEDQADTIEAAVEDAELQRYRLGKALDAVKRGLGRHASTLYVRAEPAFYQRVAGDNWGTEREAWKRDLKRLARELFWATVEDHRVDPMLAAKAAVRV
jgi:hypothetical protein